MEPDRDVPFATRIGSGTIGGYIAGSILGAVQSSWHETPRVLRDKPWPALLATAKQMNAWGVTLATIGASFALTDYLAEQLRGKKDWVNGAAAGAVAGAALGLRINRGPGVTVGAMAALAATSCFVDVSQSKLLARSIVDDGATPAPPIYPYKSQ